MGSGLGGVGGPVGMGVGCDWKLCWFVVGGAIGAIGVCSYGWVPFGSMTRVVGMHVLHQALGIQGCEANVQLPTLSFCAVPFLSM